MFTLGATDAASSFAANGNNPAMERYLKAFRRSMWENNE